MFPKKRTKKIFKKNKWIDSNLVKKKETKKKLIQNPENDNNYYNNNNNGIIMTDLNYDVMIADNWAGR